MPFDFNLKRDEINDAHGSIILSIANLTMTNLALGDLTNNIGQADTFYTDSSSVNTANSDMFTNYAVNNFGTIPPTNENSLYFDNTFAGNPMPLKDNENSGAFCGTCKPVALGDYINSNTLGSTLDGSFAIAGISSGDVWLSIFSTDSTTITPTLMASANCGISMTGVDADVRLFAHPDLYTSANVKTIIVIVNDWGNNNLYFFMFDWDHSINSLSFINQTSVTSSVGDNIKYTGKHDIFFLPGVNRLLLLRKDNRLEELDIVPGTSITSSLTITDITAVAVDEVNRVVATTDINGDLITYFTSINTTPVATSSGAVLTTVFDGCYYNNGVDPSGFYFCAVDSGGNQVVSYRFETDSSGNLTASNSYGTGVGTIHVWSQVEVPHYNVLNIGVGPNNTSAIATARVVCDSATLRATYDEYANPTAVEDFILMRHPAGSNNSINGNSAGGSGHLISVDNGSNIKTCSNNFLNTVEFSSSTSSLSASFQYIIYLGYFYNNATSNVNYLYLAISGLSGSVPFDINGGGTGGYYFYFNYDA